MNYLDLEAMADQGIQMQQQAARALQVSGYGLASQQQAHAGGGLSAATKKNAGDDYWQGNATVKR